MRNRLIFTSIIVAWMSLQTIAVQAVDRQNKAMSSGVASAIDSSYQAAQDSLIMIKLLDGTQIKGKVLKYDAASIVVETAAGLEVRVPVEKIASQRFVKIGSAEEKYTRSDPNYSRLIFGPTGRPLNKGDGYVSDYYIFFPGVSYGFTNNFTMMAGFSVIPGAGFGDQLKFISPKLGIRTSDRLAMSVGALYISFGGEFAMGIAYGVATFGTIDKSITTGLGFGFADTDEGSVHWSDTPILMVGGNIRLSNSIAFLTENWFILGGAVNVDEQPFTLALRFFGERLAVDAGFIITASILEEGFPVPWVSFVYNF
ncbi:MAG: hypothetical protein ACOY90_05235 [Candidatus Zhuqueibacterota bacterium]